MTNKVLAILTIRTENLPDNFQEILIHEREVVAQWKHDGILEQLYLRPTRNGAVLIFNGVTEEHARHLMTTLPLYSLALSVEILPLIASES
ncbi:MAG: hypothetical protein FGM32_01170 [Candidatus Kapabacteria bacterium]|nr:hypothetical protein [Candidatus Kapabacteria bacterium]